MTQQVLVYLLYILTFPSSLYTQQAYEDFRVRDELLADTSLTIPQRIALYEELSWVYADMDFEKARDYANTGIVLAQECKDRKQEAIFLRTLGIAYCMVSKYDSATVFFDKAMRFARQETDLKLQADIQKSIGNMYLFTSQNEKAIQHYLAGMKIYEDMGDKSGIATMLGNIGAVYTNIISYQQAEDYLKKACDISLEIGDSLSFAHAMHNLQIVYTEWGRYDEVKQYTELIARIFHDNQRYANEIYALHGLAHDQWYTHHDFDKSLETLNKTLKLAEEYDFPQHQSATHRMFGGLYNEKQQYDLAEAHSLRALELVDTTFMEDQINISRNLMHTYILAGKKEEAMETFNRLYRLIQQSVTQEHLDALAEMNVKYESDKKDTQIELLHKGRQLYFILTLAGLSAILLLLLALFLLNRYQRQKRLRMKEKMVLLEQEKELVAAKSLLDGENAERGRLSHELHDGLGGLLTMIKLDLEQMKQSVSENEQRLQTVLSLTDKSIQEMRRLAHNLMPESLARFGLRPVLEDFCGGNPLVNFYFYGEERRLDTDIEINLYRIACELINNALKHAEATAINTQLIIGDDNVSLTVQDNGTGFDPQVASRGLITVRTRAEFIGATLHLYSESNKGSEITVELVTNT